MATPYIDRANVISRYKDKKYARQLMLFGKDCDVDAASRSNGRYMFDGDLLIQGDLIVSPTRHSPGRREFTDNGQENALDFTFANLGIDTDRIEHPVVMTERLANPLYTRGSE